jgi:3-oxoacyl-[acyl-carrier protein] reductase
MGNLSGKIAVVTGASKGIGAQIAKELAGHGASVVVNYATSRSGAEKVVADIVNAGGNAVAIGGSVAGDDEVERLFGEVRKAYGRIDILVNNAGIYAFAPIEAVTTESITSMFSVNVAGLLLATRAALPLFPPEGGSIINIGSIAGEIAMPDSSVYSGTKGAVNSITRVLAKELGPRKIRVNAVNPGMTLTEGLKAAGVSGSGREALAVQGTPLGRIGQPEDIARVVAFLASDEAGWVTGSLVDAAGGFR